MKTITIFGATGMVGQQLVKEALLMGHTVKAFGRNVFTTEFPKNEQLQLLNGALFDGGQVRNAIKGSDAVLSAIGGAFDGTDKSRSLGMRNIIEQMEKEKVQRIVAVGGLGILEDENGQLIMDDENYPREYLPVGREHLKAYEYLKASNLNWTFVCAPDLVNADATGVFTTTSETVPGVENPRINTGDLALFMLNEINKDQFIKQRVGISNT